MEWSDDAVVLCARKHGESSVILSLFTQNHGKHSGLVRGGTSRRNRGLFEPGNIVRARWRARLPDHLGAFTCELTSAIAAELLSDRLKLSGLSAICAVADAAVPEREPHHSIYDGIRVLLGSFQDDQIWPTIYVRWELGLLQELGFRLDLSACAATGQTADLIYVSPKSGRAVCGAAGEPYKDVLLPLPAFLLDSNQTGTSEEICQALRLTGYFLNRHAFSATTSQIPEARNRLIDRFRKLNP